MTSRSSRVPAEVEERIAARLARATEERVADRILAKDDTLWGPAGQPEVADRLGWTDVHDRLADGSVSLLAEAAQAQVDGLSDVVVLGMGGSSLAPEVFRQSFPPNPEAMRLHVFDSTDAQALRDLEAAIDLNRTLFIASSKSGGTVETLSAFHHFWDRTGGDGSRFCAITDPGSGLEALAAERGFRRVFSGDPEIGGRYSALSPFGIAPAAFAGFDIAALMAGGSAISEQCAEPDATINPGVNLGCVIGELALAGRDKLTFLVDEPVSSFGLWAEQLVAESLGKHGRGILPVAGEPAGAPGDYGTDRVIVAIEGPGGDNSSAVQDLRDAGLPVLTLTVEGAADLGALMVLWEFAVATAGWVLEVNPFDQPNVQSAKDKTNEVLASSPPQIALADETALRALLTCGPPSYLAIQAFCAPSAAVEAAAADLRLAVRTRTGMATTFGYGPRYLHSTGQLHKGGPPTGRFLQILADGSPEVAAPEPAGGFERLKRAQADGDLLVLREHGLPAERAACGADAAAALRAVAGLLG